MDRPITVWISGLAAALLLVGASGCANRTQPTAPITAAELADMTVEGVYDTPVRLDHGVYEGEPLVEGEATRPRLQLLPDAFVTGDFDGDGNEDAAVLLSESSGGSGVFTYLAVVSRQGGKLRNVATTDLGDRVMVRDMEAADGAIQLDLVVAGLDDPACCPTAKVHNVYHLEEGRLTVQSEDRGHLSAADLEGVTWRLTDWGLGDPIPEGVDITARFDGDQVSGSGGCNNYHAGIDAGEGSDLTIGPAAATRMACPDPVGTAETRYFKALEDVSQFSFLLGKLLLYYQDGDQDRTLIFVPTEEAPAS